MTSKRTPTSYITQSAVIAAIYVVLTVVFAPISFNVMQVRISEMLTILPLFTSAAIPGLFIGCILGNLLGGAIVLDVVFGSIATLIGAIGTRLLRKKPLLAWIPPVLSNAIIVPFVLQQVYGVPDAWWYLALTVGAGEVIACGVLGLLLYKSLSKTPMVFK